MLNLHYDEIPSDVIKKIKLCLLDTIGVILGGSAKDIGKVLGCYVRDLGGMQQATALGFGFKTTCENVAFLCGSLTEMLEMQDGFTAGASHPSSTVIPSVLPLAEERRSDGKSLIEALVVGYESSNCQRR
jgi:2-methylcitrate dehydratase PrpD